MNILISVGKTADPSNYVQAVKQAGADPFAVYLPEPDLSYDGLILAGGGDVEPALFGQKNVGSHGIDFARDRAELTLLDAFVSAGKPVLGICRGHQVVNIWAGGGLIQDLGGQNAIHQWDGGDRIHLVFSEGGMMELLFGGCIRVNSAHHQAVGPVGKGLRVTARSADGIVEAMEHERFPVYTVQFHPERMRGGGTADGDPLFHWFVGKCGKA